MSHEISSILKKAVEALDDARFNLEAGRFNVVVNRGYYVIWGCIQALLLHKKVEAKTHIGAQKKFHELFVKSGIFPARFAEMVKINAMLRKAGDYDFTVASTEEDAKLALENAQNFLKHTIFWLRKQGLEI